MIRTLALGALGTALLAATADAQCFPFSKRGLRRVDLAATGPVQVGDLDGDTGIAFTFEHDPDQFARLAAIVHRGPDLRAGQSGSFDQVSPTQLPGVLPTFPLWRALFRTVGNETGYEVGPADARDFDLYVDDRNSPQRAVLRWSDVCLGQIQCADIFWLEICLEVDGARSEWNSRLGRIANPNGGEPVTLDEVGAPIVHACTPDPTARLLVPTQTPNPTAAGQNGWPAPNLPLAYLGSLVPRPGLELEHPARGQAMQFSAVFGPQTQKILYFASEDDDGYYKKFFHDVVGPLPTCFYRWEHAYFPPYGPSPYVNFHSSDYPVVVSALTARSPSYWYDVAEEYRRFVDREIRPTPVSSRWYRGNRDYAGVSHVVATSTPLIVLDESETDVLFEDFVDQSLRLRRAFPGADGQDEPTFMEWQKWLLGTPELPDLVPETELVSEFENPAGPGFNPAPPEAMEVVKNPTDAAQRAIARARAEGINMSTYTIPVVIDRDDWPSFREHWLLRDRNFQVLESAPGAFGEPVDFGNLAVPFWHTAVLYDSLLRDTPDLNGVLLDVLSGGGSSRLRFPKDSGMVFRRRFNGGSGYVRGVRRFLRLLRGRIKLSRGFRAEHPDVPFLASEVRNEFIAGEIDFAQAGFNFFPGQLQLAQFFDLALGQPLNADSNELSPPLWNAVYHESSRADGLATQLQTKMPDQFAVVFEQVKASLGPLLPTVFPRPDQQALFSLPLEERARVFDDLFTDYNRMVFALFWYQGMKNVFQYIGASNEPFELLVDDGVGGVTVRAPSVPGVDPQRRVQLLAFLRRLHESISRPEEAGQFLLAGRMERPLARLNGASGYDPLAYSQTRSPSIRYDAALSAAETIVDQYGSFLDLDVRDTPFAALHFYETPFTTTGGFFSYNVPHVLHQVWRSSEGELGLVFVNWADEETGGARWIGTLDPALYDGLGDDFEIVGVRPDGAGVQTYPVASCSGRTTLSWGDFGSLGIPTTELTHHSGTPGGMPARSVQVFLLRSRRN